jgi:hypothetical protein
MNKWVGVRVGAWQITGSEENLDEYVYEDVEVGELLDREGCTEEQKDDFLRQYASVNIHQLVSEQTYDDCMELLQDMQTDPRLTKLNAVVFLMLKPKGRGTALGQMKNYEKYKEMVDYALARNLRIGFDSCSVPSFLNAVEGHADFKQFEQSTDRCESGLFSLYIDVKGRVWPCSFGQNRHDLEPIDVLEIEDFERDVWLGPQMSRWRERLLKNERSCPLYDLDIKKP